MGLVAENLFMMATTQVTGATGSQALEPRARAAGVHSLPAPLRIVAVRAQPNPTIRSRISKEKVRSGSIQHSEYDSLGRSGSCVSPSLAPYHRPRVGLCGRFVVAQPHVSTRGHTTWKARYFIDRLVVVASVMVLTTAALLAGGGMARRVCRRRAVRGADI